MAAFVKFFLFANLLALTFRSALQSTPVTEEGIKRKLELTAELMDKDKDGKWSKSELVDWSRLRRTKMLVVEAWSNLQKMDKNSNEKLEWSEYTVANYGTIGPEVWKTDKMELEAWSMVERDRRKWNFADIDNDGALNDEELRAFMYPEFYHHMLTIATEDRISVMDTNGDGSISEEEYIDGLFHGEDLEKPELRDDEKRTFKERWDTNGDGELDTREASVWLDPGDDAATTEALLLLQQADENNDEVLTKDEMMEHYLEFTKTQITNWGEDLHTDQGL